MGAEYRRNPSEQLAEVVRIRTLPLAVPLPRAISPLTYGGTYQQWRGEVQPLPPHVLHKKVDPPEGTFYIDVQPLSFHHNAYLYLLGNRNLSAQFPP